MLRLNFLRLALALVVLFGVAVSLPAQITSSITFGFGEDDGLDSTDHGGTLNAFSDTSLGTDYRFTLSGNSDHATYTAATPHATGSTIAAHFTGDSSYVGDFPLEIDGTASFGLQLWVRPDNTIQSGGVAYNGHSDSSGLGILQSGDRFVLSLGGVIDGTYDADTTFLPDSWNHLAVVYQADTHTTSLYQNGAIVAATTDSFIPVGTEDNEDGDLSFGASYTHAPELAPSYFSGSLDSAQFFTFDGTFDAGTMLTYTPNANAVPEPATSALLIGLVSVFSLIRRNRKPASAQLS